jgi:signal transduction histidine kinase
MLDQLTRGISIPLGDTSHIAVACAFGRRPIIVSRPLEDPRVRDDFRRLLGSREFVLAPLIARGEPVGVLLADNLFSGQPISEEHVELLSMFANQAAIAIENAGNYRRLQEEKIHLEAAYRDLAEAEDRLIRSERLGAIGRMATHVAHEIRNPLVTIGGFANTLLEHPDSPKEEILRYLKIIASEVRRLEDILARVMDFTRPPKPLLREGALEPVIRETIEPLRQRAEKQRVEIRLDLPPEEARLQIDADQMKQVFLNLFQNALDAMRDGGRLTVQVAQEPDAEKITVANTGDPIRPEDLPKLFEPFFTTKPGGTGLGLPVSQRIIQDHGGAIRVVSSLERGTEFIITLPRKSKP